MASQAPLAGLLVVDLSRHLPGPLVTRLLGDLGCRVIKIEEPRTGDPVRQAPPLVRGRGALAALLLAGHESVALDLKREPARAALAELLERADVLVESFRPGTLGRLGLAPPVLRQRYPRLVICSVTGFGQAGPHASRAGHDLTYQALAGSLSSGGERMPSVQVADVVGAWSAAAAVLAALLRRQRDGDDGGGAWIDQALLDAAGHAAITAWAAEADGGKAVGEPLMLTGALPCYSLYRTRDDGVLALACLEPHFWRRFCTALDRRDLVARQYSGVPEVRAEVAALILARTREEWCRFMDEHDLPAEPVLSLDESRAHPQVGERGLLGLGADGLPRLGYPACFDGVRPRSPERFADLGEDTDAAVEEFCLAPGRGRLGRRWAGIGRRFSVRRLLLGLASRILTRRTSPPR